LTPEELERRKKLTFEEAEGLVPMPSQLQTGEISQKFRAIVWSFFYDQLRDGLYPWADILVDAWVLRYHLPADDFSKSIGHVSSWLKNKILNETWSDTLGMLEFILRHPRTPDRTSGVVSGIMVQCGLAYRVVDGQIICPIASDNERATIERAFSDLHEFGLHGARTHLRKAAEELMARRFADSVRESIHAVESAAEALETSGQLSKALDKLESSAGIHGAMKRAFLALYGYTSNAEGVRHALVFAEAPSVDETDALFMIGACAAFVSYLVNKARSAGLQLKPP
jgi:hypothetical protein